MKNMVQSYPAISVVIPTLNCDRTIGKCLASLNSLDYPKDKIQFLIVDSGSTDETLTIAKSYPVTIINEPRKGRGFASNRGFQEAANDYVAFVDSDAVVPSSWLKTAMKFMAKDSFLATIHFRNIAPSDSSYFQKCVDTLISKGRGQANGAVYRKNALERIGGFNNALPYLQEDDVRMRLIDNGFTVRSSDSPVIWHYPRRNLRSFMKQCYEAGFGLFNLFVIHKKKSLIEKIIANCLTVFVPILSIIFLLLLPALGLPLLILTIVGFIAYSINLRRNAPENYKSLRFILPATFLMWFSQLGSILGSVKASFVFKKHPTY